MPSGCGVVVSSPAASADGDAREAGERRFVAPGVQAERRLVGPDVERLGGDDLAGVDVRGHQVPGDAVGRFTGEDRPRGHVEPGVAGQRAVVEVDPHLGLLEHGVGQDPQVGDAQQDVELVRFEGDREVAGRVDVGDPVELGERSHDRVVGGDHDDVETVLDRDLGALGSERLVADYCTPNCIRHVRRSHRRLLRGFLTRSPPGPAMEPTGNDAEPPPEIA